MKTFKHHITLISALVMAIFATWAPAAAQKFQSLPADKAITSGKLPNGIQYYLVPLSTEGKNADFTLVRRNSDPEQAFEEGRWELEEVNCFGKRRPVDFLKSNGIYYSSKGYVYPTDKATIYSFKDVSMARNEAVTDSLLLLMHNIIADKSSKSNLGDFAIIIAGGIDKAKMLEKIKMLSLTIPPTNAPKTVFPEYSFGSRKDNVNFSTHKSVHSRVVAEYRLPRPEDSNNATVLPLAAEKMSNEVAILLDARINSYLLSQNIPFSRISTTYIGPQTQGGDIQYRFSVYTDDEYIEQIVSGFSMMLSTTRIDGVSVEEIKAAEALYYGIFREYKDIATDIDFYTSRCINSFLYNASLSSQQARYDYLVTRPLADSVHLRIFNNYLSQLFENQTLNINVYSSRESFSQKELEDCFFQSIGQVDTTFVPLRIADIPLVSSEKKRTSTPFSQKVPTFGCSKFVLSNGMTIYYKQLASASDYTYKFYFPDNLATAASIRDKEGAFFADMFFNRDDEFTENDYLVYLAKHGITMIPKISLDEFSLSGTVEKKQLDTLFMVMQRLCSKNVVRRKEFDDYLLRQGVTVRDINATSEKRIIDSLVVPDYKYTAYKTMTGLHHLGYSNVQDFYDAAIPNVSKGTLFLVGSLDEDSMNKQLEKCLSIFPQTKTKKTVKNKVSTGYKPQLGYNMHVASGDVPKLDFQLSCDVEFTAANYFLSMLAAQVMEGEIRKTLIGTGLYMNSEHQLTGEPRGRFFIRFMSSYADAGALSPYDKPVTIPEAVNLFRKQFTDLSSVAISAADLNIYKNMLIASIQSRQTSPDYWIEMMSARYIQKKDFLSKYSETINAITPDQVRDFIALLTSESMIGYMVQ